jgi:catechol 2,3-dioxygenase-like lactoylglutathione lyase family enzyme
VVTSGIERILISVKNIDESLAFFRDWVGMKVIAEQLLNTESICQLLNSKEDISARAVFLKNREQPTLIELIECKPRKGVPIRKNAKIWDYGLYDICFLVNDVEATYRGLTEKGFSFISPPISYSPDWLSLDVKETILIGPDEMPIAHAEIIGSSISDPEDNYRKIFDSAQIVEDMDEAIRFYRDILGLTIVGDNNWSGLVDDLLGLPPGTDMRMVLFTKKNSSAPVVECITFSRKGKKLGPVTKPPNLGIFMIAFLTTDLTGSMEKLSSENIQKLSGPVEMELAPYGKIKAITVRGPSDVMIEIFEIK